MRCVSTSLRGGETYGEEEVRRGDEWHRQECDGEHWSRVPGDAGEREKAEEQEAEERQEGRDVARVLVFGLEGYRVEGMQFSQTEIGLKGYTLEIEFRGQEIGRARTGRGAGG